VTTINFIAAKTKKNLIFVTMINKIDEKINIATIIIKIHGKNNHCHND
jgi:hypothetical protein